MANKKISQLDSRASLSLSDLMAVGDPSTGYLYKTTISDLKTLTGAGVISFNGRFGAVSPAEGDYLLNQLGDVIITSASNGQVLKYNGSNWVNAAEAGETDTLATVTARGNVTTGDIAVVGKLTIGSAFAGSSQRIEADPGAGSFDFVNSSGGGFYYRWIQNGATAMQLSTANNLLIGTTTDAGYKLDVNGTGYVRSGLTVADASAVNTSFSILAKTGGTSGIDVFGVKNGAVFSNGNFGVFDNYAQAYYFYTNVGYNFIPANSRGPANLNWIYAGGTMFVAGGSTNQNNGWITVNPTFNYNSTPDAGTKFIGFYYNPTNYTDLGTQHYAIVANAGRVQLGDLAGTGTRIVTADANGVLSAGNALSGYVTLDTAQTISGAKVFSTSLRVANVSPSLSAYAANNSTYFGALFINDSFYQFTAAVNGSQWLFKNSAGDNVVTISHTGTLTAASLIRSGGTSSQFLKADGSVDSNAYLPLTGGTLTGALATSSTITGSGLFSNPTAPIAGLVHLKQGTQFDGATGFSAIGASASNEFFFKHGISTNAFYLSSASITSERTYTLPDASGTIALTSNLSSYLPLSGGTLTGALSGTSASFSGGIVSNGGAIGYGGGELGFGVTTSGALSAIYTLSTSSPTLFFDHRATSNTGNFVFRNGTGGSNTLLTIASTGAVGIGTSIPNAKLQVGAFDNANALVIAADPSSPSSLYFGDGTGSALFRGFIEYAHETDTMSIGTSSTERIRITSIGNLEIGNASKNTFSYLALINDANTNGGVIAIARSAGQFLNSSGAGDMIIGNSTGENILFGNGQTGTTEYMRITSGGNVGIGTSSPNNYSGFTNLQVNGSTNGLVQVTGASATTGSFYAGNGQGQIGTSSNHPFILFTNDVEKMRITSAGLVGIGTSSPSYLLQLNSDSAAKPSTNTWTISSDGRIKENIEPYTKGLDVLLSINPVTYDYNGKAGFNKIKGNIGIIAQDVLEILPESISTYKAKLNEEDKEETELFNFNSHALTYVLINAIKEQQAQIESLKKQLN